ncbi:MAG: GTP 3',8-cyclase MoaA [Spirochaetaceae bacterium]|jgi:cyclic pyranopterin phosphate synthase|nr:GTP 3',8-cyclase MoaA [Spirochaetaceae bacterium]
MKDRFGRTIDYLRVSVTDRCSLRCLYCMPPEGAEMTAHGEILSFEEILRVCAAAAELGVRKFKVTGGEPLVRRGIVPFVRALKRVAGVGNVTLTTNGVTLGDFLDELLDAGVDAVNVSLDTLNEAVFRRVTRSDNFEKALRSVYAARNTLLALKLNCVPVRGINEDDIVPLAELARERGTAVRFIELMPLGLGAKLSPVPREEIFDRLQRAFGVLTPSEERLGNGPAEYYSVAGFTGKIGFISALSHNFCGRCNRLRLTGTGLLKPCLSSDAGVDIKAVLRKGGDEAAVKRAVRAAVMLKPARHDFSANNGKHETKNMFRIGG